MAQRALQTLEVYMNSKKIIVLGIGLVGKTIAVDLCRDYQVSVADMDANALNSLSTGYPIRCIEADLSKPQKIEEVIAGHDLVIGAIPGFLAFQMLTTVINCRKDIVDISFFPEDPFALDELAKHLQVTVVIDCGVAPGMDNIILGYHNQRMQVEKFECLVGGLPVIRHWPYSYKAVFSPMDVIEEYTRPARIVENGAIVVRPALSDPEYIEFEEIGTLEAFNTDGLRTLLTTMKVPNMKEKTLRYPGHIEYMKVLRETGFFDQNPIQIKGMSVRPIDMTAKLLFPKWQLQEGEPEFTVMHITVEGKEKGEKKRYIYNLLDRYDPKTRTNSMARTTGYTCTAIARLVLDNKFTQKGICPPEYVGAHEDCFSKILAHFEQRNLHYRVCEQKIE